MWGEGLVRKKKAWGGGFIVTEIKTNLPRMSVQTYQMDNWGIIRPCAAHLAPTHAADPWHAMFWSTIEMASEDGTMCDRMKS